MQGQFRSRPGKFWALCCGEEGGASAGDEMYLVCAAVAAAVGLPFFWPHCNSGFALGVLVRA